MLTMNIDTEGLLTAHVKICEWDCEPRLTPSIMASCTKPVFQASSAKKRLLKLHVNKELQTTGERDCGSTSAGSEKWTKLGIPSRSELHP